MEWTDFDPSMLAVADKPIHITISPRRQVFLNRTAVSKLGEPVAVRLMFNEKERVIGIAAAPLKAKGAIELRLRTADSGARAFNGTPFCQHIGLNPERTLQFHDPKLEGGVLVLDLKTTTYARRRAEKRVSE